MLFSFLVVGAVIILNEERKEKAMGMRLQESGDKMYMRHLENMWPDECLLVPPEVFKDMCANGRLIQNYWADNIIYQDGGFSRMTLTNCKGHDLKVYSHPDVEYMRVEQLTEELMNDLAWRAL